MESIKADSAAVPDEVIISSWWMVSSYIGHHLIKLERRNLECRQSYGVWSGPASCGMGLRPPCDEKPQELELKRRGPARMLREKSRRTGSPKRGEDHRHITDFGPRQYRHLWLCSKKRLEQQADTESEGNDAGPDRRERTEHE